MTDRAKESFNSAARRRGFVAAAVLAAGVAGAQADDMQTQYQLSLRHTGNEQQIIPPGKAEVISPPQADRPSLGDIWAQRGLDSEKITTALAALTAEQQQNLARRSDAMFKQEGFADVLHRMEGGKQKKLTELVQKLADMPDGMQIITTNYVRIDKEQNDKVWLEFQEKAEPAFYKHLAATREAELRDAGFCDYAIDCLRRGLGPTNAQGISYNVDIDHLTERAGGGVMCTEKSVDPVLGGDAMFPINHASNLCLIMREVHVQVKNEINALQNISEVPHGETRRIMMAVPEEGKQLMMLHAKDLRAEMQPPPETSYFALGPSLLITNKLQEMREIVTDSTPAQREAFFNNSIRADFEHTLKLWDALATSLQHAKQNDALRGRDITRTIGNCDDFLKPLESMMTAAQMPQEALDNLGNISKRIYAYLKPDDTGSGPAPKKPEGRPHANA